MENINLKVSSLFLKPPHLCFLILIVGFQIWFVSAQVLALVSHRTERVALFARTQRYRQVNYPIYKPFFTVFDLFM